MDFVGGVFLYKIFKDYIVSNNLLQHKQKVLAAVSGGADSMCLLALLQMLAQEWQIQVAVCHVNHNLRGLEADKDAEFVLNYCCKHSLECEIISVPVKEFAKQHSMSIEQAARALRYEALSATKNKLGCDLIATAHNKNDQAETFLLNMLRGAGINGLKGMLPQHGAIIRPLLDIQRKEIESFCLDYQLEYCHDSTNDSLEYLRNRVRHELIPALQEYNPNIINSLTKNMQTIRMDVEYLNEQAQLAAASMISVEYKADCMAVYVDIHPLRQLHQSIALRVLLLAIEKNAGSVQGITQAHLLQVYKLIRDDRGSKKLVLPNDIFVRKFYDKISISKSQTKHTEQQLSSLLIPTVGSYLFNDIKLAVTTELHSSIPKSSRCKVYIPCELLTEQSLCVRSRMSGDYFELTGGGRKSVKSFFIDQKIPREQRDSVPLLYLGEQLLCILGYRCVTATQPAARQEYLVVEIV